MNQLEWKLRNDICEVAKRLYHAGFMTGGDGNLSTILGPNEVLVTPSRLSKGFLTPDQIVEIDKQGEIGIPFLVHDCLLAVAIPAWE